ncbi:MAG: hypothetical protein CVT88_00085 [Candidatus Altiarchaeales archaeon HGW-Altiarchaeales-1]|nr:MAG: hypothetical protein CVT88_00085 [Candidatus Altiarchaeales archaeon HGW-Altiarchaeales-1]
MTLSNKSGNQKENFFGTRNEPIRKSIYKTAGIIGFLVKVLRTKYPEKRISPAYIQRIGYFLKRENVIDFKYSMYPDGPGSNAISVELSVATHKNIVEINYLEDKKGYFVEPGENLNKMIDLLTNEEKNKINKVADEFGQYDLRELSEKATDVFILNRPTLKFS